MNIKYGHQAPDFDLPDQNGDPSLKLADGISGQMGAFALFLSSG